METNFNLSEDDCHPILAFDTIYTTNHMKILKTLYPYVDDKFKNLLAVYIKYQEFTLSIHFMNPLSSHPTLNAQEKQFKKETSQLLSSLSVYCNEEEKKILSKIQEFFQLMENLIHAKEYLPMLQGLLSGGGEPETNLMELLGSFLSEEQKEIFSQFTENNNF
ncbi:MAG: hypothetical protein IKW28_02580 [Lachnospiraceae bacterium]|nr:hypothetical protein [Lachnospiraceae bacterium]